MRLYEANTLKEYIAQLKHDITVLEKIDAKADAGDIEGTNVEDFLAERDSHENHSEALAIHHDDLRHRRMLAEQARSGR